MSGGAVDIRVGDIVSRCGDDRLRVTSTNAAGPGKFPDLIDTVCTESGKGRGGFVVGEAQSLCADDVRLIERFRTSAQDEEFERQLDKKLATGLGPAATADSPQSVTRVLRST